MDEAGCWPDGKEVSQQTCSLTICFLVCLPFSLLFIVLKCLACGWAAAHQLEQNRRPWRIVYSVM